MARAVAMPEPMVAAVAPSGLSASARAGATAFARAVIMASGSGTARSPGEQGPAGPPGPQGPAFEGFGYARYAQAPTDAPLVLQPGQKTALVVALDATKTRASSRLSFEGWTFFDGITLRTPRVDDLLDIRIACDVTATLAGGSVLLDAELPGGVTVDGDDADLLMQANTSQRVGFKLFVFSGETFQASGLRFYLTSPQVPCAVSGVTVLVGPKSAGDA